MTNHCIYFKPLKVFSAEKRPAVLSEFGGYSYIVAEHVYGNNSFGYKMFKTQAEFEDALCKLYENEVMALVNAGVSALVYTQLSDIEDETNGLITYDREVVKVNKDRCREVMAKITASN